MIGKERGVDMPGWTVGIPLWLLLMAFFAWRLWSCVRRRDHVGQEITALVYLAAYGLLALLSLLVSAPPQWLSALVLAAWLLGSGALSFRLNRTFNQWMDRKREEEQRRGRS